MKVEAVKLPPAELFLLRMASGAKPLSPFKLDQDTLGRLWSRGLVDIDWDAGVVTTTPRGRDAVAKGRP